MIFTSAVAHNLKAVLDDIINDPMNGKADTVAPKWMEDGGEMEDQYVDVLEMGGIPLASEIDEGAPLPTGDLKEGVIKRFLARKFGLRIDVTEEAMEDSKYPEVIQAGRRLDRSVWKTWDIDCTSTLVNATSTSFLGADGVALASTSHTLPNGGTFSNMLATPYAPSLVGLGLMVAQMRVVPGHDSQIEGCDPRTVVYPEQQWVAWAQLAGSTMDPVPGNFAAINVIKSDLDLKFVPIKYWSNTATKWGVISDTEQGLQYRWRKKPTPKSWVENNQEVMSYAVTARWDVGWADPRGFWFSDS